MKTFSKYYENMMTSGDCDPAYPSLKYVCDRFDLNREQRYWIAFLYATNYCAPTTYYIYNEFPDFENVDVDRLQRWWDANKDKLLFQTDRAKVKNFNLFVKIFESYRDIIQSTQHDTFKDLKSYDDLYDVAKTIYYFGRFSIFNYLEAMYELTGTGYEPTTLELNDAESSRNGLCYAVNKGHLVRNPLALTTYYPDLEADLVRLRAYLNAEHPNINVTYWNIETCLCAFKKLYWGRRYLGYYIDRQQMEIEIMEANVTEGVDWSVLWDFRREFFHRGNLGELRGRHEIHKSKLMAFKQANVMLFARCKEPYITQVDFEDVGKVYK